MSPSIPRPGDVVRLTRAASPQFGRRSILVRVAAVADASPPGNGWRWIRGYRLDGSGCAVERRELFVRLAGIEYVG